MRTSVAVNICINCIFFTLIFAVFLLMSSPISCRSISTVKRTFKFLVVNLCLSLVGKVGLIAISHKFWKWKFAHLLQGEVAGRFMIWCSLWHLQRIFVTFCVIFAIAQWLYTGRQARTGGTYLPNTHRNIRTKYLNMQCVEVLLISFLNLS